MSAPFALEHPEPRPASPPGVPAPPAEWRRVSSSRPSAPPVPAPRPAAAQARHRTDAAGRVDMGVPSTSPPAHKSRPPPTLPVPRTSDVAPWMPCPRYLSPRVSDSCISPGARAGRRQPPRRCGLLTAALGVPPRASDDFGTRPSSARPTLRSRAPGPEVVQSRTGSAWVLPAYGGVLAAVVQLLPTPLWAGDRCRGRRERAEARLGAPGVAPVLRARPSATCSASRGPLVPPLPWLYGGLALHGPRPQLSPSATPACPIRQPRPCANEKVRRALSARLGAGLRAAALLDVGAGTARHPAAESSGVTACRGNRSSPAAVGPDPLLARRICLRRAAHRGASPTAEPPSSTIRPVTSRRQPNGPSCAGTTALGRALAGPRAPWGRGSSSRPRATGRRDPPQAYLPGALGRLTLPSLPYKKKDTAPRVVPRFPRRAPRRGHRAPARGVWHLAWCPSEDDLGTATSGGLDPTERRARVGGPRPAGPRRRRAGALRA